MIFSDYYDKSLWLMLHSKGLDRWQIVDFIKRLTPEMCECVRSFIRDYYKDDSHLVSHRQILYKDASFRVEINDDILTIILNKYDMSGESILDENFEISLFPFDSNLLDRMNFHSQGIGNFSYGINWREVGSYDDTFYIQDDVYYTLTRDWMNYRVKTFNFEDDKCISSKRVNIDNIPIKMYAHQFENEKGVNRLVRRRCKK